MSVDEIKANVRQQGQSIAQWAGNVIPMTPSSALRSIELSFSTDMIGCLIRLTASEALEVRDLVTPWPETKTFRFKSGDLVVELELSPEGAEVFREDIRGQLAIALPTTNQHTLREIPNAIFRNGFEYSRFMRRYPPDVREAVERAVAHPECYRAQTAHLQCELAHYARQLGMTDAARQLQALCTDPAQCAGGDPDRADTAPRSSPPAGSPAQEPALRA